MANQAQGSRLGDGSLASRLLVVAFGVALCQQSFSEALQVDEDQPFMPRQPKAGPWVEATLGKIWPAPKFEDTTQFFSTLHPSAFHIELSHLSLSCDIITESLDRFRDRIFPLGKVPVQQEVDVPANGHRLGGGAAVGGQIQFEANYRGLLKELTLDLLSPDGCERHPHADMHEAYEIFVDVPDRLSHKALLRSQSVWGLLRGLESFSQLVYSSDALGQQFLINSTYINDEPAYSHRGVMLDSSRHFLSKRVIMSNLDLMEMNKMNVFHWHLSDDQSFPYQSSSFPELSEKGAFHPRTHVYSPSDVQEVIEAARIRGIRVIPEFDVPGHSDSWGNSIPNLLAECDWLDPPESLPRRGGMNPVSNFTYDFLSTFFKEIFSVFPDKLVHLGGDEISLSSCWMQNQAILREAEKLLSWRQPSHSELQLYFMNRLVQILRGAPQKKDFIVWQDMVEGNMYGETSLNPDHVTLEIWKNWGEGWKSFAYRATRKGFKVIISAPWYLNYYSYGSDWLKHYGEDLKGFGGSPDQQNLVVGGEVCLWGEFVNNVNLLPRLWPRASAVAETLWSPKDKLAKASPKESLETLGRRMQEHECRMLVRGYPVQPIVGSSYCPVAWAR